MENLIQFHFNPAVRKMRFGISALIWWLLVAESARAIQAATGYRFGNSSSVQDSIRLELPQSSFEPPGIQNSNVGRLIFLTLSVTLATSVSTTTSTTVTYCTTSTSALKICTPSGRRRRGISDSGRQGFGLYYNEEDETQDGTVFLPGSRK